jgi:hypothetical protein
MRSSGFWLYLMPLNCMFTEKSSVFILENNDKMETSVYFTVRVLKNKWIIQLSKTSNDTILVKDLLKYKLRVTM